MNIDGMEAGREMDALVAEKVMGSPKHQWSHGIAQRDILGDYEGCTYCECTRKPERENETCVKPYSIDIAAAWEVFDHIAALRIEKGHPANDGRRAFYKPVVRLEWFEHDGEARVIIGRCKSAADDNDDNLIVTVYEAAVGEKGPHGSAECLALAICRAALKAVL